MKLIIDIPEEVYKKAKETHDVMCDKVWLGIKYGTPLDVVKADIINIADGRQSIKVRSVLRIIDKYMPESEE